MDAPALFAFFDRTVGEHWSVAGEVEFRASFEQLVLSPFVLIELEVLVRDKFGVEAWLVVLDELAGGAWTIAEVDAAHLGAMRERVAAGATLAGASVAVLLEGEAS